MTDCTRCENEVDRLKEEIEELQGEPCSICGSQPSVLIDKGHKETYWKCHECIREDTWENVRLRDFAFWLTPCADIPDNPKGDYPSYKLIGEKAKALLEGSE